MLVGSFERVERRAHLAPARLPGGDAAVRNPWRMALSYLHQAQEDTHRLAPATHASAEELRVVKHQIATGFNSPRTSSMGRLFDAVASLLDVRHTISHEAQAAIELEVLAGTADAATDMSFALTHCLDTVVVDARPVIRAITNHLRSGAAAAPLALGFHLAVADLIANLAEHERSLEPCLTTVALTGGVFQNDLLTSAASTRLRERSFDVLTHRLVPANDGGLSLGQAAIASYLLSHASARSTR